MRFTGFLTTFFTIKKEDDKLYLYQKIKKKNLDLLEEEHKKYFISNRDEQFGLFFSFIIKSSLIYFTIILFLGIVFFTILYIIRFNNRNKLRKKIINQVDPLFDNYTFRTIKIA